MNSLLRNTFRGGLHYINATRYLSSTSGHVGFVGLGNMGGHMANNIAKSGHKIVVCDLNADAISMVVKESGASVTVAKSVSEVASLSDVVVTMLPSSPQVRKVYDELLKTAKKGCLFIDSTTGDPAVCRTIEEEAISLGMAYVDAPVSGGVLAARDATLTFMVGGAEEAFTKAKPFLEAMGKNVIHCGSCGTGEAAKICNNMLLAISMIGVSEAYNLGARLGLEPAMLAKVINTSSGRCWSSDTYNPVPGVLEGVPASRDYAGGFNTHLMTKDLGLAQDAATSTKSPTPLGSLSHQLYRMLCQQSHLSDKDFGVIYQFLKEQSDEKK